MNENDNDLFIGDLRTDPQAFTVLFRAHYDEIFRYCARRLFDRHAAEDVVSGVFLKVLTGLKGFKGDHTNFRNWLYKIATNEVNQYLRVAQRRNKLLKAAAEALQNDPGQNTDVNAEKLALLKQSLLSLKPAYQAVIALRFFENMKSTEIARVLGASPATVRSRLSRALAKLRKKLTKAAARTARPMEV